MVFDLLPVGQFFWTYFTGTVSVLATNCLTPSNLGPCVRVWEWVPPYVSDVKRHLAVPAYQQERDAVSSYETYQKDQAAQHR